MATVPLPPPSRRTDVPAGVAVPAALFVAAGLLDFGLAVRELPRPVPFWPFWEALGQLLAHALLALGLWRRIAVCRSIALVYCLASVVVYAFALALAWLQAPVSFPDYVVVQSLFQVPSCILLFHYLRSDRAGALYPRPLIG